MLIRLVAALCLLGLAGCGIGAFNRDELLNPASFAERESDVARTFDRATVVLPRAGAEPLVSRMDRDEVAAEVAGLPASVRYPAVLYMHGCTGLENLEPLTALARAGFVVIAPDSFARRFRPLQCRPSQRTGGENIFVFDFRLTEISYALHRLEKLAWIDRERLFLVGTSEGGLAAALYRGDDFRARVITQWTCHGAPLVRGLAAPPDEPVLAIVRANDPWYDPTRTARQRGDCGAFLGERPRSRSVVLVDGQDHDVYRAPGVLRRIVEFLVAEANPSPKVPQE
jgi:dienelactone hydrolase